MTRATAAGLLWALCSLLLMSSLVAHASRLRGPRRQDDEQQGLPWWDDSSVETLSNSMDGSYADGYNWDEDQIGYDNDGYYYREGEGGYNTEDEVGYSEDDNSGYSMEDEDGSSMYDNYGYSMEDGGSSRDDSYGYSMEDEGGSSRDDSYGYSMEDEGGSSRDDSYGYSMEDEGGSSRDDSYGYSMEDEGGSSRDDSYGYSMEDGGYYGFPPYDPYAEPTSDAPLWERVMELQARLLESLEPFSSCYNMVSSWSGEYASWRGFCHGIARDQRRECDGRNDAECSWILACQEKGISLRMSGCRMTGDLAQLELHKLPELSMILLPDNGLTGTIPATFSKLKNLNLLDLSDNQLTGTLPKSLAEISNLQLLAVSGNSKLHGPVPVVWFNILRLDGTNVCLPPNRPGNLWDAFIRENFLPAGEGSTPTCPPPVSLFGWRPSRSLLVLGALLSIVGAVALVDMLVRVFRSQGMQQQREQQQPRKEGYETQPLLSKLDGCVEEGCGSYSQLVADTAESDQTSCTAGAGPQPAQLQTPIPPIAREPPQSVNV